jgi:phosphatidylserine/phosphatidylglycerophosphate/cardiolipin synthase-like enzyme
MWDERYSQEGFAYGSEPNEFLKSVAHQIPPGPVLCLGEGEGRNAIHLASLGHRVVAVDQSAVGLAKARQLAESRGLTIETVQADLAQFDIEAGAWAGVVSIFCHLPTEIRVPLYEKVVRGLRAGGVLVRQLRSPTQHSKVMQSDRKIAFVGSQNVTATSLDLNRELGMLVSDAAVLARLASIFETDWARASER